MDSIRHNIIFSVMAHSILLAAALLIGGSSEIRKASLFTVSLFNEKNDSNPGKRAPVTDIKQNAATMVTQKAAMRTDTTLSAAKEIMPIHNLAPLPPVKLPADTDNDSGYEVTGIQTQIASSPLGGNSRSSVSSQAVGSSSGEADPASASRGQTSHGIQKAADPSLKQRIRDTLQNNLVYPYIARKRRMEGTVLVDFRINNRGSAEHVRVLKGSGYALLDSSAMETVVKSSPFPLVNYSIEVPITYRLTQN